MATQGKIRIYKRTNITKAGKENTSYSYSIEAGKNPKTGKRQRKTGHGFKTATEARRAAQGILNKLLLGQNIIEQKITFKEYAAKWFKDYTIHKKDTTKNTIYYCFKIANKYLGMYELNKITPQIYQDFLNEIAKTRTKATVYSISIYVKLLFKTAYNLELILTNPTLRTTIPISKPPKVKTVEDCYMTKEELNAFLKCTQTYSNGINKYIYPLCLTLVYTGLRIGEACALIWDNVDFERHTITVEATLYTKTYSKNDYKRTAPKTKSSTRVILIGDYLTNVLKQWRKDQLALRILYSTQNKHAEFDFVFTKYITRYQFEYPILMKYVQSLFRKINAENTFSKHIHPHLLRHTHVSLLAEAGVSLEVIQERLGHSSSRITRKIYLHITNKAKANAVTIFENYMTK